MTMGYRLSLMAGAAVIAGGAAQAETLQSAWEKVYRSNPSLTSARAELRATDENVPIARANGLPSLSASGSYTEFPINSRNSFTAPDRDASAQLQAAVPLYQGGAVRNAVKAADARVGAGRASLRSTEANVFAAATQSYLDVLRDQAVLDLNINQVKVLETNLEVISARFRAGDLTRTDIAQSQARLGQARAQLGLAQAQIDSSRETYLQVIGTPPVALEQPQPLPPFPKTVDDVIATAIANNPQLVAARAQEQAALFDVKSARALNGPRLSAIANGSYSRYFNTLGGPVANTYFQTDRTVSGGLQATLPLFQGGGPGARVRQAQALQSRALEQITLAERAVISTARSSFARYNAALAVIAASQQAVAANEAALKGVRAEARAGTRDVIDLLNAEQELLNSRVQLVTANRDAYLAGFDLLVATGQAEAKDLGVDGGPLYDPAVNYRRVRHSINDFASDPTPTVVSTTTAGMPMAQVTPVSPVVTPALTLALPPALAPDPVAESPRR